MCQDYDFQLFIRIYFLKYNSFACFVIPNGTLVLVIWYHAIIMADNFTSWCWETYKEIVMVLFTRKKSAVDVKVIPFLRIIFRSVSLHFYPPDTRASSIVAWNDITTTLSNSIRKPLYIDVSFFLFSFNNTQQRRIIPSFTIIYTHPP